MPNQLIGDINDLVSTLEKIGGGSVKFVNDSMHDLMTEVQIESKARAPVEHGQLENSIKITNSNRRQTWSVYVDEDMPDDTGKYTVGDYALIMHERFYSLGKDSRDKAAGNGKDVGRKYLENPFFEIINSTAVNDLQSKLAAELDRRAAAKSGGSF